MTHSNNSNGFIQFKQVSKWFESGAGRFDALKNIDLNIKQGEHVAIVGKSGSGKSVFIQNLAVQDVINGEGVCVIEYLLAISEYLLISIIALFKHKQLESLDKK